MSEKCFELRPQYKEVPRPGPTGGGKRKTIKSLRPVKGETREPFKLGYVQSIFDNPFKGKSPVRGHPVFNIRYPSSLKAKKHKYSKVFNFPLGKESHVVDRLERIIDSLNVDGYSECFMGKNYFYMNQLTAKNHFRVF